MCVNVREITIDLQHNSPAVVNTLACIYSCFGCYWSCSIMQGFLGLAATGQWRT